MLKHHKKKHRSTVNCRLKDDRIKHKGRRGKNTTGIRKHSLKPLNIPVGYVNDTIDIRVNPRASVSAPAMVPCPHKGATRAVVKTDGPNLKCRRISASVQCKRTRLILEYKAASCINNKLR